MNIEYVGRGYHVEDRDRRFCEDKLGKIARFLEEPAEVRVTLEVEKYRHVADLHVAHRHGILQATEETAGDMHEAINAAVEKLEKQARRSRKKLTDRKRRVGRNGETGPGGWPLEVLERESFGSGREPRIVKSTRLEIKPMSLEEAALQLETSRNDFLVFRDATNDRVSVLYKRKDENYGLIVPEA